MIESVEIQLFTVRSLSFYDSLGHLIASCETLLSLDSMDSISVDTTGLSCSEGTVAPRDRVACRYCESAQTHDKRSDTQQVCCRYICKGALLQLGYPPSKCGQGAPSCHSEYCVVFASRSPAVWWECPGNLCFLPGGMLFPRVWPSDLLLLGTN